MYDFELNLRKTIKNCFLDCNLKGCYFHYIKNLWAKAKKFGLFRKKYINKTKILIFGLKLLTLINLKGKMIFLQKMNHILIMVEKKKKNYIVNL